MTEQLPGTSQRGHYGQPRQHRVPVGELSLCCFEWGEPGAVDLLLLHATGFHGRCWDQVVAALPAGLHILAPDMRGHGRSDRLPPYHWSSFGADLEALTEHFDVRASVTVGHSMGGHCALQLAAARPHVARALLLLDPVVFEPDAYPQDRYRGFSGPEQHPVARRRSHFDDWQQMREQLKDRGSFGLWQAAVFEDYCRYGVLPVPTGGVELACPPLVEASVYLGNTSSDVHARLAQIQIPVDVLRAPPREQTQSPEMDWSKSPTWPGLAAALPMGRDRLLEDLTHFIPMQAPALVADQIAALLV